jgi:hypothetical protein
LFCPEYIELKTDEDYPNGEREMKIKIYNDVNDNIGRVVEEWR